jgi:hypothetical protein
MYYNARYYDPVLGAFGPTPAPPSCEEGGNLCLGLTSKAGIGGLDVVAGMWTGG